MVVVSQSQSQPESHEVQVLIEVWSADCSVWVPVVNLIQRQAPKQDAHSQALNWLYFLFWLTILI